MSGTERVEPEQEAPRRLFLERRSYTQRRLLDAAKLLPLVGLVLWMLPLVWPSASREGAISGSGATLYIFAIWALLIALGGFLAYRMAPSEPHERQSAEAPHVAPQVAPPTAPNPDGQE